MKGQLRVLFIQGSDGAVERAACELRSAGYTIDARRIETAETLRATLAASHFDLIIGDWLLPAFSALAALAILQETGLAIPFIVVSETADEDAPAEAMRAGARDFVLTARLSRLTPAVERELRARPARYEALWQVQKLEAIGQLASSVSHDFSNLLSVILSYTELVIGDLAPSNPLRSDLIEVQRAGQRAAWLTGQLLAFGRRQVRQSPMVDLNDVVAEMETMMRRLIGEDVELTVNRRSGLPCIAVDPGQIEQVLMNLAVNARDAMPHGGKLTIETANVELDEKDAAKCIDATAGPHVLLAMTDTGCGIDDLTRARIFEPFFTTKEKGKGTGLGLSTVLSIVRQNGGTLSVESQPGIGTSFRIYFVPAERAGATATPIAAPEIVDPRGCETILLVEDDEQLRVLAHEILRRYGYRVLEAQGAGDALLISEQHDAAIDLLLTDVVMPRISGRQLADRLLRLRPEMGVLYMSGYAHDEMLRHGILDSGAPLLQKPITPEVLARKVRETLDQAPRRTAALENHHVAHPSASGR